MGGGNGQKVEWYDNCWRMLQRPEQWCLALFGEGLCLLLLGLPSLATQQSGTAGPLCSLTSLASRSGVGHHLGFLVHMCWYGSVHRVRRHP